MKSSSSSLIGESVKASSWCCSGTNMFLGHMRMALMAVSLQQHSLVSTLRTICIVIGCFAVWGLQPDSTNDLCVLLVMSASFTAAYSSTD